MATESRLRAAIRANHAVVARILGPDFPRRTFERIQQWQRRRLALTHADLVRDSGTRPAAQFFLDELYGGLGFLERDRQLERVLPLMERLLPAAAVDELAGAFELQALSLSLDADMACRLAATGGDVVLDDTVYASTYRSLPRAGRERQLALVGDLGRRLSRLVEAPLVLQLVRTMRIPARAAGVDRLQQFLEGGLQAFRGLPDSRKFVATVVRRERRLMERLYDGANDPRAEAD